MRSPVKVAAGIVASALAQLAATQPVAAGALPSLAVESRVDSAQLGVFVTFGQAFAPRDVPLGSGLAATVGTTAVPLQVDVKARHSDGSLRHAVLTVELPSLASDAVVPVQLSVSPSAPPAGTVTLQQLLASGFDASVQLGVGGVAFTASARRLLQAESVTWLNGPLVSEWLVSGPVEDVAGQPHPHLVARFAVRAYAGLEAVRVDLAVENAWAYEAGPGNVSTDVVVEVGGQVAFSQVGLTHYRQARWRKVLWWGDEPRAGVRHDARYLVGAGAIPSYQPGVEVPESAIAELAAQWAAAATGPMQAGLPNPTMPTTGSRPDIAPLPRWAALYLLSMDRRAEAPVLGTSDLAGSWGIHYRDRTTDLPVSLDDHPEMTLLAEGQGFDDFPSCAGDCSTPFTPDSAHQPSFSYLPYLLTGDHYHLEELQFWANWNMLQANPAYRDYAAGLLKWDQVRGQAWSLRTLAHAAWVTPDDHPLKTYFVARLQNNLSWYRQRYPEDPAAPTFGFLDNGYAIRPGGLLAPWEDDFFTAMVGWIRDLGFTGAAPLAAWKARFVAGRFTHDPVYCRHDGAVYEVAVVDPDTSGYVDDWGRLLELSFPEHVGACPPTFNTYLDATDGYLAHARAALAVAVDQGHPEVAPEIDYLVATQEAAGADYAADPSWGLSPRGTTPLFGDGFESGDTTAWSGGGG